MAVTARHTDEEKQLMSILEEVGCRERASWLNKIVSDGRDGFKVTGFPQRRMENWRYTDLKSKLGSTGFSDAYDNGHREFSLLLSRDLFRVVVRDGVVESMPGEFPKGLNIRALSQVIEQDAKFARKILGQNQALPRDPMTDLNSALLSKGLVINVEAGCEITKPIFIERFSNIPSNSIESGRDLIVIGKGAKATIVEVYTSGVTASTLTHNITEAYLQEGASLSRIKLQMEGDGADHVTAFAVEVEAGATFESAEISLGAPTSRNETLVKLQGEGAHVSLSGAFILSGIQHCDMTTVVSHEAPNCTCVEEYRGVMAGRSRGIFQGKIGVAEGAQKTDARMMTRALLLSDKAEMDAKPELEIYADDVKCAHGATIGTLDEEALFYFQSRGISRDEAKRLLMAAFVGEAIELISNEDLRDIAGHFVREKLALVSGEGA